MQTTLHSPSYIPDANLLCQTNRNPYLSLPEPLVPPQTLGNEKLREYLHAHIDLSTPHVHLQAERPLISTSALQDLPDACLLNVLPALIQRRQAVILGNLPKAWENEQAQVSTIDLIPPEQILLLVAKISSISCEPPLSPARNTERSTPNEEQARIATTSPNPNPSSPKTDTASKQFLATTPTCKKQPRPSRCSTCGEIFANVNEKKRHVDRAHKAGQFRCDECGAVLRSAENLRRHKQTHLDGKLRCVMCSAKFVAKGQLGGHLHRIHGIVNRKRRRNGVTVSVLEQAERPCAKHETRHALRNVADLDTPFKCPECPLEFKRKGSVDRHVRVVHRKERPFQCGFCDERFANRYNRGLHENRMHAIEVEEKRKEESSSKGMTDEHGG